MKLTSQVLVIFVTFCALVPALRVPARTQDDDNWRWVNEHYDTALHEAFPIDQGTGQRVGVRCYRDLHHNVLEWSLVVRRDFQTSKTECLLREAQGEPIADQLYKLHRNNPTDSVEALAKRLRVRERVSDDDRCLAVRTVFDDFYHLRLPMMTQEERTLFAQGEAVITLHPLVYDFSAHITDGYADFNLTQESHPFVVWALTARQSIGRCP